MAHSTFERTAQNGRTIVSNLPGKQGRRLADQIAAAHSTEVRPQGFNPAFLGLSASNPINGAVTRQGAFGRVRVGRLAVVDECDVVRDRDPLLAMRQPGKALQAVDDCGSIEPERAAGCKCSGCVLGVVVAR